MIYFCRNKYFLTTFLQLLEFILNSHPEGNIGMDNYNKKFYNVICDGTIVLYVEIP